MKTYLSRAILFLGLFAPSAFAQSTAAPVTPGNLTTVNCPSGYTVCFVPYSTANPMPVTITAGSITIGKVDQGNAGTAAQAWFIQPTIAGAVVSAGNPLFDQLTAGSAIIGKAGIDQTTPGTTNGVVINSFGAGALNTGTPIQTSVSCGNTSTTLLAASTATKFVSVKVPSTAANIVWFNWAGVAAVTAPPSEDVGIGAKITWTPGQGGFLPTSQINCIASSATTVTLEYQ